ncbi:MAG: prolipoprotein diacylglyceryl transferase, partial [Bacillaceae bacterium]|nr:prolipoprotein diacylglyceryl transferase [Bacillaceae bacterium]
ENENYEGINSLIKSLKENIDSSKALIYEDSLTNGLVKKHKISVPEILDIVAPSLILAQAISRIGCDVFGGPLSANVPWSIEYKGEMLHPAQAYEFILNYLLFGYLWLRLKRVSYHGQVFVHYLIGFLVIRGIVEFTRINPMVFGPFSVSHVMSLIGIIFALLLAKTLKRQKVEIINQEINKDEIAKTAAIVISLITISLFIYYTVQG